MNFVKNLLLQYKPFFIFLIKFFTLYAILSIGYKVYLNQFDAALLEVDTFTEIVGEQSKDVLVFLGKEAEVNANIYEPCINLIYKGKFVARIIEGCNAVSVMILFASFIFAFSAKWMKTILYILIGCFVIHLLNILRIALLAMALYNYPKYEHLLHGVIFPLVIYSVVFALWFLWLYKFFGYEKSDTKK
ncbi:exosortase family protein XrtF [Flavobacterium sp. SM15]|uniref:exosortase family protein XrtF n=1 Tax=Flavobacterium sp. SM15 TaxID=2908005 RepID=UPI001EDA3A28|nr:exosortase family protein XrtF [Flavobacterium sp. SM15]MCG2610685.1 exosortase family protein XrtF [Flavobacterium sp. SM15]